MIAEQNLMYGIVRNGVIFVEKGFSLPDGATVEIKLSEGSTLVPDTLASEFAAWDQAGAGTWAMIEQWERDENQQEPIA